MTLNVRSQNVPEGCRAPRYSRRAEERLLITESVRDFFRNALSRKWTVCTFCPTPEEMCNAMIDALRLQTGQSVLELGSGTGPVTAALDERMPEGCTSLSIELNRRLCRFSQRRLPHMNIIHGNAMDLKKHMETSGMQKVHGVISGLPFPSLPTPVVEGILTQVAEMMTPEAVVTQITALGGYEDFYRKYFEKVMFSSHPHGLHVKGGFYTMEGPKLKMAA